VNPRAANSKRAQRGAALLLCLFALLLLSGVGTFLYMSSGTEMRITSNYGSNMDAYYAARFGVEEVRDRMSYSSTPSPSPSPTPPPGGLAEFLPQDIAGNPEGVLYVLNPASGETLDPTDVNSRFFDDQLCHDYNSGVPQTSKCNTVPSVANWKSIQPSLAAAGTASALKWVRINMKTNRIADPFFVDATNLPATLDDPVCWDGQNEQLSPGGALACDANGMQNVYMLTALAVTPGLRDNAGRTLLRSEVVAPAIRPPGAITMDAPGVSAVLSNGTSVPQTIVDGRPHKLDGALATNARCSQVAALATDNATASTQLQQALNAVRWVIVNTANSVCNADGSGQNGNNCPASLWWVRGTGSLPRFSTSSSTGQTSGGSGSSDGGSSGSGGSDGGSSGTSGNDGSGGSSTSSTCGTSTSACYTALNLAAPELYGIQATAASPTPVVTMVTGNVPLTTSSPAPFIGGPGNQGSGSIYQSAISTLPHTISALTTMVHASVNQPNYFAVSSANLAASYGSSTAPAIVVITDSSLKLQNNATLSGYGVLVVPNDLEISNAKLQWTGIVLVQSTGSVQFNIGSGGTGFINGALLLQAAAGSSANLISGSGFQISYSCDAIDMAFGSLPLKVVASSQTSY
jgi:hypothetical protein